MVIALDLYWVGSSCSICLVLLLGFYLIPSFEIPLSLHFVQFSVYLCVLGKLVTHLHVEEVALCRSYGPGSTFLSSHQSCMT